MKTKIFYFSGTGNSLAVAKDIAKELGDAELVPITYDFNHSAKIEGVNVGFVFPVYCWGPPLIVRDFVTKMSVDKNAYIFCAVTYGGMLAGSVKLFKKMLQEKGLNLAAGFAIRMPGNYTPMYNVWSAEKQIKLFDKEKIKIKQIAETVKNRGSYKPDTNLGPIGSFLSSVVYGGMIEKMRQADKAFFADENCNKCGICVKVCPAKNIKIDEKVSWLNNCEQCLRCFHWCPQKAIQVGQKTITRGRYHHPGSSVQDFIQ